MNISIVNSYLLTVFAKDVLTKDNTSFFTSIGLKVNTLKVLDSDKKNTILRTLS
jgi:hypothetical protein